MKKWFVKKKMITELSVVVEAVSRESAKALAEIEWWCPTLTERPGE